ncbi:MAG: signal peptidase II [Deltaproteobacteria bacterium]|nr:signal peptidase II [Deltaproteobacteria bacterium]MCL5792300.1 signal peptidase II [Deltaproteobacteria bacterium]
MIPFKKRISYLLIISLIVILIDQISKYVVVHYLSYPLVIIPGMLELVKAYNHGIAFGFFNKPQCLLNSKLLTLLSVGVLIMLISVYIASKDITLLSMVSLSMIIGGAMGNIIDRLRQGYVVDFIDAYIKHSHWPTFNVADSAITIGAVLLGIDLLFSRKKV